MIIKSHQAPHVPVYLAVFAALMVLTVVTVSVSYFHLPATLGILVGLLIATVKASLVAAFFMHLKGERALIYSLLCLTVVFTALLFLIPITDSVANADLRPGVEVAGGAHHAESH